MPASMRGDVFYYSILIRRVLANDSHSAGAAIRSIDAMQRGIIRYKVNARTNWKRCYDFAIICVEDYKLLVTASAKQAAIGSVKRQPCRFASRRGLVTCDHFALLRINHNDFAPIFKVLVNEARFRVRL